MSKAIQKDTGARGTRAPVADGQLTPLTLPLITLTVGLLLTATATPPKPATSHQPPETTQAMPGGIHRPAYHWYSVILTGEQHADIYRF
jgi:hypothetical protein